MKTVVVIASAALGVALLTGCTATQEGAVAGTAIGAGTGAIIGNQTGHSGGGALIGGAIGAVSGAVIGHEIEKNKASQTPESYTYESAPAAVAPPSTPPPATAVVPSAPEPVPQGKVWVPEHEEIHVYIAPDGSRREEKVVVPGHYE